MNKDKPSRRPSSAKPPKGGTQRGRARKRAGHIPAGAFEDRESENASGPRVPKRLDSGGPRGSR